MANIEVGIATQSDTARGIDVAVSVDGHDGEVTLLPAEDGSGYYTSWGDCPAHWVSAQLLAYIQAQPDAHEILRDLAMAAGAEADAAASSLMLPIE